SVVSAQRPLIGELAGAMGELAIHLEHKQLVMENSELPAGVSMVRGSQSTGARCGRERCACLRIAQDAGDHPDGRVPKLDRGAGAVLGHQELDQGGGVEVMDQRRCWAM